MPVSPPPVHETRFFVPPTLPALVRRERLTAKLNHVHALTLIAAPAGYGKTTLATEWLTERQPESVAWLSLTEADNDPVRFLAALLTACQPLAEGSGRKAKPIQFGPHPLQPQTVLTSLLAALGGQSTPTSPKVLVLDDYHLIETEAIHTTIEFLVEQRPLVLRLIITSRTLPPGLPLARWRARGQLTELLTDDLRFTEAEAGAFLNHIMGLKLSPTAVAVIEARTEGWIVALRLAALSLAGQASTSTKLMHFTGTHRHLVDYLAEEVLDDQSVEAQTFLLQTSILDQFCAPLCEALIPAGTLLNAQTMLERLERANLFVIPLDPERRWFRYHSLFAEFLRQQLARRHPDWTPELHRRASDWYESAGDQERALHHAVAAQQWERAAQLVDQCAEAWMQAGEISTLLNRLRQLPEARVRTSASLCLWYGWTSAITLNLSEAERWVTQAESALRNQQQQCGISDEARWPQYLRAGYGQALAIRALVARLRPDTAQAIQLALRALELLPENEATVRSVAASTLGLAQLRAGDFDLADETLERAHRWAESARNAFVWVTTLCHQGGLRVMRGQLHAAHRFYSQALAVATDQGLTALAALPHIRLARVLYHWRQLPKALAHLTLGLQHVELAEYASLYQNGYLTLARLQAAQGQLTTAQETLTTAEALARRYQLAAEEALTQTWRARLRLHTGDLEAAEHWAQASGIWLPTSNGQWQIDERRIVDEDMLFTLCRWLITTSDPAHLAQVEYLLAKQLQEVETQKRWGSIIEVHLLQSLWHRAKGQPEAALAQLETALALAEPQGYVSLFVDEGQPVAALLARVRHSHPRGAYAGRLLACFPAERPASSKSHGLIVPLNEHELAILRLLATGLSNAAIARERVLAVSTVRWYIKHLYQKLGVHNRTQAADRARALSLL